MSKAKSLGVVATEAFAISFGYYANNDIFVDFGAWDTDHVKGEDANDIAWIPMPDSPSNELSRKWMS